jgi:hypothetical protein
MQTPLACRSVRMPLKTLGSAGYATKLSACTLLVIFDLLGGTGTSAAYLLRGIRQSLLTDSGVEE